MLVAPAFLILLWPQRQALLHRFGRLLVLVIVGLAPYAWMVRRSWQPLPISFDGPLETIHEILFFIGRKGYAGIDHSVSADWLDRLRFFRFLGGELFMQFAVLGTLLVPFDQHFGPVWKADRFRENDSPPLHDAGCFVHRHYLLLS